MKTSNTNIPKETTDSKRTSFIPRLQSWFDSVQGQTYMNYAYSVGAAIVILGTLFKLVHLPGSNFFLFLGLGTEVIVFLLSCFDRPFRVKNEGRFNTLEGGAGSLDPELMKKLHLENLDETVNAVKSAYLNQLNSIQKQTDAAEKIAKQTTELSNKMEELSTIYSRMISAARSTN